MAVIKEGAKAPAFKGVDQNGKNVALADFKGQKLVLYFYPKDDTPGCTAQACNLKDNYKKLMKKGLQVLGVSVDSVASHQKFITKYELPFELISDTDETLCQFFDVIKLKNMYGKQVRGVERSTFIFDSKGILRHEWRGLKVAGHVEEVLRTALAMS